MTTTTTPGGLLTPRQAERRRAILRAATALAARGGYEAVQMREVAECAQVALGTLYQYFPSKVHLLVAVMQEHLQQLHEQIRRRPPTGDDPATRVAETITTAFHTLQREPRLAEAMVRALSFADRSVSAEVDAVSSLTSAIVLDAARLSGLPSPDQQAALRGHRPHPARHPARLAVRPRIPRRGPRRPPHRGPPTDGVTRPARRAGGRPRSTGPPGRRY